MLEVYAEDTDPKLRVTEVESIDEQREKAMTEATINKVRYDVIVSFVQEHRLLLMRYDVMSTCYHEIGMIYNLMKGFFLHLCT